MFPINRPLTVPVKKDPRPVTARALCVCQIREFERLSCCRFANRGNYEKAILDFEKALGEDPNHQNAKKYMGETLIAQAKA